MGEDRNRKAGTGSPDRPKAVPAWLRNEDQSTQIATTATLHGTHGLLSLWEAGLRSKDSWYRAIEHLEQIESPAAIIARHVYAKMTGSLIGPGRGGDPTTRLRTTAYKIQQSKYGGLYVQVHLSGWFPDAVKGGRMLCEYSNGVIRITPLK